MMSLDDDELTLIRLALIAMAERPPHGHNLSPSQMAGLAYATVKCEAFLERLKQYVQDKENGDA